MIDNSNKLGSKNLDKSYDMLRTKNSPIPRREINKNILTNINETKIMSNNYRKIISHRPKEDNSINNLSNNGKIYNKLSFRRKGPTYIKKSPGKINSFNSIENKSKQNKIHIINKINNSKQIQNKYSKINT